MRITEKTKYTVYGTLFGLCFPVGAVAFIYIIGEIGAHDSPYSLVALAHQNSLLYIIDMAPFFLGLFSRFAGVRQDKLLKLSASLEQQVAAKTNL